MDTIEKIHNALEWANKRLTLQGEPITQRQRDYLVFALREQFTKSDISDSLSNQIKVQHCEQWLHDQCDCVGEYCQYGK
jgi:hypothetical protein